jgi:hypothetical protein
MILILAHQVQRTSKVRCTYVGVHSARIVPKTTSIVIGKMIDL